MNNLARLGFLSFSVASLSAVVGCSSTTSSGADPFGPDPDYAAIQQRFDAPSGTVSDRNLGALFKQFSDQRASSSMTDVSGATALGGGAAGSSSSTPPSTGGTYSKALRILDLTSQSNDTSSSSSCSALAAGSYAGSCACAGGGSFEYDFSSFQALRSSTGNVDASLRVRFDACHYGEASLDGREFVHVHAARTAAGTLDESSLSMIMVADFTVGVGGQNHTVDLASEIDSKSFALALQVDDGWVTIRATTSGTAGAGSFVVRDRNGSWSCDVSNGAGTCKDASGATHKF